MSWITAQEAFAEALPGYEDREEQTALAEAIELSLASGDQLAAQAGCGTGKSFAALVGAIDWSKANGSPVVIATATKALQTQYAAKDLPFLERVIGGFRWAVVKGRGAYVCQSKLAEGPDVFNIKSINEELETFPEHTGDLDDFVTPIDMRERHKLISTSDECPGKDSCPFGNVCFAEAAKTRAAEANIVVANHSVVITDAQVRDMTEGRGGMLPNYGAVVVDEAHELEDYTTNALGNEFTERKIQRLGVDAGEFLQIDGASKPLSAAAMLLFRDLADSLGKSKTIPIDTALLVQHFEAIEAVLNQIKFLHTEIRDADVTGTDASGEVIQIDEKRAMQRKRLMRRFGNAKQRLESILVANSESLVRWVERDEKQGVVLKYAPLYVGEYLARNVWDQRPVVLMSATLAVGGDFAYIAGRLGLGTSFVPFDAGSPFDFAKQSALYIPRGKASGGTFPEPGEKQAWQIRVANDLVKLIAASKGRALLLFTSRTSMNAAYDVVASEIVGMGYTVLRQGDESTRVLADRFKNDEHSVLFGLKSFMTGADFQGSACRLVVLDKLPFAVPDDVIVKARNDATDARVAAEYDWLPVNKIMWQPKGSFFANTVPAMALTLLQAFGRLIRTKTDEGLVVIFDNRLLSKGYGKKIMATLPQSQRMDSLTEACDYLAELDTRGV